MAYAVARAGKAQPWRALIWLAEQVETGALAARLYKPVEMSKVDTARLPEEESKRVWRSLAKRAKTERDKDMLDHHLPTPADTWCVHVKDLMQFVSSASIPDAVAAELSELAERHRGTLPFPVRKAPNADTALGVAIDACREGVMNVQRPNERPVPVLAKTHTLKRRSNPLKAVLAEAEVKAVDRNDWSSVWAALVLLAQRIPPPAPLTGYVEGEGVQYQTDKALEPVGYLTRNAFRNRFKRKNG